MEDVEEGCLFISVTCSTPSHGFLKLEPPCPGKIISSESWNGKYFLTDVERGGRVEVESVRPGDGESLGVMTVDEQLDGAPLHHDGQPVPGGGEGGDGEDRHRLGPQLVEGSQVEGDLLHAEAGTGGDAQAQTDDGVGGRHH